MENKTLAKFISLHEDTCKDFTITEQDVIIGRKKTCGCKIPNTKISGEHCRIRLDTDSGVFTITDLSTNGTFVNDTKIKKDQPTVLNTEDRIYLLKDQAEDTQIGFIFIASFKAKKQASGLKRTRDEVDQKEEEDKQSFKRFKSDELDIEDQVKCSLCLEVMYKPVSLLPCLHNFCGGCYSGWIKKHDDCPECRGSINHIKQNKMLISMIH